MEVLTIESKAFQELLDEIRSIKVEIEKSRTQNFKETYLSSNEVCKTLGISAKTWQSYRDRRMMPFIQVGAKIYVKVTDLEAFLTNHSISKRGKL